MIISLPEFGLFGFKGTKLGLKGSLLTTEPTNVFSMAWNQVDGNKAH